MKRILLVFLVFICVLTGCSVSAEKECETFYEEFKLEEIEAGKDEAVIEMLKADIIDACLDKNGEDTISQPDAEQEKELDLGNFVNEEAAMVTYENGNILAGFDGLVVKNTNNDNRYDQEDEVQQGSEAIKSALVLKLRLQ